jgi:hypothetical protein
MAMFATILNHDFVRSGRRIAHWACSPSQAPRRKLVSRDSKPERVWGMRWKARNARSPAEPDLATAKVPAPVEPEQPFSEIIRAVRFRGALSERQISDALADRRWSGIEPGRGRRLDKKRLVKTRKCLSTLQFVGYVEYRNGLWYPSTRHQYPTWFQQIRDLYPAILAGVSGPQQDDTSGVFSKDPIGASELERIVTVHAALAGFAAGVWRADTPMG